MIRQCILAALLAGNIGIAAAQTGTPVVTDSRIKTLVYNENDVFSMLTHYGYQSNIEFGKNEAVRTVSVGDRIAWQIVPAGRRLFIKALEENAHTNMTVVTNKRAYQFDLRSSGRMPLHPSEELVYVVRFFYPDEQDPLPDPAIYSDQAMAAPAMAAPAMGRAMSPVATATPPAGQMNFNYTLSGPDTIAPVRIYDDGRATYFRFPQGFNAPVQFYALQPDGGMQPLPVSRNANGELILMSVQPKVAIQSGGQRVIVYNETMPSA